MTESDFQGKLVHSLRNCNAIVLAFAGSKFQIPGIPDTYVAHSKWVGWIEFKGAKTKIDIKQTQLIKMLKYREVSAFIVREPNIICDAQGAVITTFIEGSGNSLLDTLKRLP